LKETTNEQRLQQRTTEHEHDVHERPSIDPRQSSFEQIEILLVAHFKFDLCLARDNHSLTNQVHGVLQRNKPFDDDSLRAVSASHAPLTCALIDELSKCSACLMSAKMLPM
jgi:hypothetical protein